MKSEIRAQLAIGAFALILGAATAIEAWAQSPSPLLGDWRASDHSNVARVSPCSIGRGLCATVIEERPVAGETSLMGQVVVRNLVPTRRGWGGVYEADGHSLTAQVRLLNPDTLELTACMGGLFCDTAQYRRVRP